MPVLHGVSQAPRALLGAALWFPANGPAFLAHERVHVLGWWYAELRGARRDGQTTPRSGRGREVRVSGQHAAVRGQMSSLAATRSSALPAGRTGSWGSAAIATSNQMVLPTSECDSTPHAVASSRRITRPRPL